MDNLKTQPRYDRGINYLVAGRLSLFYDYSLQLQLLPSSQNFFFQFHLYTWRFQNEVGYFVPLTVGYGLSLKVVFKTRCWFLFRILQFVVMKIAMRHEMSVDYVRIVVDDFLLDCS